MICEFCTFFHSPRTKTGCALLSLKTIVQNLSCSPRLSRCVKKISKGPYRSSAALLVWFSLVKISLVWLCMVWFGWDSVSLVCPWFGWDKKKTKKKQKKNMMTCRVAAQLKNKMHMMSYLSLWLTWLLPLVCDWITMKHRKLLLINKLRTGGTFSATDSP